MSKALRSTCSQHQILGLLRLGSSLISYRASDVLSDPNKLCGSTHRHEIGVGGQTPESHSRSQACMQAEVAIAADYSMYTKYGQDVQALSDHLIGIKNLMEPNYSVFNVEFSVVTVYVVTNPGGDPWTSGTDPNQLLDDFCCWAGTGSSGQLGCTGQNGFGLTHDVGELWTNRDFTGSTVGLAWIGTICSGMFRYSVDQHYTTSQQSLRVLIAHECGHNFGANHDGSGSYIMAPSVNPNATQFSSTSQSAINAELPGYTCMGSCVPDCPDPAVDMEIVSLSAGDCGSSQYDLTVVVTHGGGNGSGFNVNIDGTDHFRSFSSSPQTVVISNLSATGQSNVPVSVAAVTSGAPGCNDAATFNAPSANCGYEEVVDFNDCALPPGWSESTTNLYTFTINGVADPEWQYEWKFDNAARPFVNYNDYENANSLLTIDGTCMALFDDDISSLTEYSGVNTLTTKAFDITDFENNILSFDYNFNNFEEGKSANGSYFQVQVWDGSGWVQVLYDDNDACPWTDVWSAGCTTSFSVAVDAYRSSAFKVRFIYSDGDDGEWTGMVALDNFRLTGDVINTGPCNQSVTITPPQANGLHQANLSISTSGNIVVTSSATYNAPINVLNAGFEVANGAVFEVKTGGCE